MEWKGMKANISHLGATVKGKKFPKTLIQTEDSKCSTNMYEVQPEIVNRAIFCIWRSGAMNLSASS